MSIIELPAAKASRSAAVASRAVERIVIRVPPAWEEHARDGGLREGIREREVTCPYVEEENSF
jgi:hypothetical protein